MGVVNPKPTSADTPNQSNYQDDQNFTIDIDQIYKDWIVKIDSIRSITNTAHLLSNIRLLRPDSITCLSGFTKPESTVQESRCHAFYRLIGLPVISEDSRFYSPGFDIVTGPKSIKKSDKKAIMEKPIPGFNELAKARETYALDNLKTFSTSPVTINSSVLALSSGGTQKLRNFVAPLEKLAAGDNPIFLDTKVDHTTYDVDLFAKVGEYDVSLTEFRDSNSTKPTTGLSNLSKRSHIIAPLIVNGIIDFTVNPQSKLIAVPFIPNESFLKVNAVEKVERPVIEKIIRERLATTNTNDAGTNAKNIEIYIQNFPIIKDNQLIKLVTTKDIYQQSDSAKFISNLNTIRAMMKLLVNAQKDIVKAQKYYYWVPSPSSIGPEGGSKVQKVFLFTSASDDPLVVSDENSQLQTALDEQILKSSIMLAVTDLNSEAATQLKFPVPTTDFSASNTSSLGDNNAANGETLSQTRERILAKANAALRTIEVITGEFSGLGLCDIVAIISALNIMDKEKLLGLLDTDAYDRMVKLVPEAASAPRNSSVTACLQELTERVKDYYNLMDQIYKNVKENQGIS